MGSEMCIRDSVKWGFERRIEQGHYLTPTKFLLGYDKTKAIEKDDREMYIVEEEAKTVRVIYMMFLAGYRVSEIAYELTRAGVATGKGNTVWNSSSVLGILRNERYCGDVRTNKTYTEDFRTHRTIKNRGERKYVYESEHHPAIVTHEEYEMAQRLSFCGFGGGALCNKRAIFQTAFEPCSRDAYGRFSVCGSRHGYGGGSGIKAD